MPRLCLTDWPFSITEQPMSLPKMVSHFSAQLALSIEMPESWIAEETEAFPLLLLSPSESGYRSNLGFSLVSLPLGTPEDLEAVISNTKQDQQSDYPKFKQLSEQRSFQDNYPLYLQTYQWHEPSRQIDFCQVLALMVISPEYLYEIHGATLSQLSEKYLPILNQIINSIRVIPPDE